jgi:hypothetical protein
MDASRPSIDPPIGDGTPFGEKTTFTFYFLSIDPPIGTLRHRSATERPDVMKKPTFTFYFLSIE